MIIVSNIKFDALSQWQVVSEVDRASAATHVLLPGVATRFAAASSLLLSTEGSTNLSSGRSNVAIDNTAVRAEGTNPAEVVLDVLRKN